MVKKFAYTFMSLIFFNVISASQSNWLYSPNLTKILKYGSQETSCTEFLNLRARTVMQAQTLKDAILQGNLKIKQQNELNHLLTTALLNNKIKTAKYYIRKGGEITKLIVYNGTEEKKLFEHLAQNPKDNLRAGTLMAEHGASFDQAQAKDFLRQALQQKKTYRIAFWSARIYDASFLISLNLFEQSQVRSFLRHAIQQRKLFGMKFWSEKIRNVNELLLIGAYHSNLTIMQWAINRKAWPFAHYSNKTATIYCLENRNHAGLSFLASEMAKLPKTKIRKDHIDLLIYACKWGKEDVFDYISKHLQGYHYEDNSGNTPLIICAKVGFLDLAKKILEKDSNIFKVYFYPGVSGLEILTYNEAQEIFKKNPKNPPLLAYRSIDVALTNAVSENDQDIIELLKKNGALPTSHTVRGLTVDGWVKSHQDEAEKWHGLSCCYKRL